jgi:hypothetical protein
MRKIQTNITRKTCSALVSGQNVCTRPVGHNGEHRCKASDVDARRLLGDHEWESLSVDQEASGR